MSIRISIVDHDLRRVVRLQLMLRRCGGPTFALRGMPTLDGLDRDAPPDVIILGGDLSAAQSLAEVKRLHRELPTTGIVVLTQHASSMFGNAVRARGGWGACGLNDTAMERLGRVIRYAVTRLSEAATGPMPSAHPASPVERQGFLTPPVRPVPQLARSSRRPHRSALGERLRGVRGGLRPPRVAAAPAW